VAGPDVAPQVGGDLLPGAEEVVLGDLAHLSTLKGVFYGKIGGSQIINCPE
jgi:hypothetical protein